MASEDATGSAPHALKVGARVLGYEIRRVLGVGGFGIVYEGHNRVLDHRAAIKEFFPVSLAVRDGSEVRLRQASDAEFYKRILEKFEQSTTVLRKLDHPNIARVHGYEAASNTGYMIMDFIEGEPLDALIARFPAGVDQRTFEGVFKPVCAALEYVHGKGVLHRDVKPGNIMIRKSDGAPVLIDFGALKQMVTDELSYRTTIAVASPAYAPPEQLGFIDEEHRPCLDVYSLAATMYVSLTGDEPVAARTRSAKQVTGAPDPYTPLVRASPGTIRPVLAKAIDHAMRFMPKERPQSVRDFMEEVGWAGEEKATVVAEAPKARPREKPAPEAAAENSIRPPAAIPGRSPTLAESVTKPASRKGLWAAGLAVLAAAGALGIFLMQTPAPVPATVVQPKPVASPPTATATKPPEPPPPPSPAKPDQPATPAHARPPAPEPAKPPVVASNPPPPVQPAPPAQPVAPPTPKPGDHVIDCNGCPRLIVIPGGRFSMGSVPTVPDHSPDEAPAHEVAITRPFLVGMLAVTFADWESCVAGGGCKSNPNPDDKGWGRGTRPVINVSWRDAQEYLSWLSAKTGKPYRLLSEAEREFIMRATPPPVPPRRGNKGTIAADTGPPDAFGLLLSIGNVWEWTQDCWNGTYSGAPVDGSAWLTGDCSKRVVRGGSWESKADELRPAFRNAATDTDRDDRIGFRIARPLE